MVGKSAAFFRSFVNLLAWLAALAAVGLGAEFQIEANIRYSPNSQTVLDILQPRAPALKDRVGVILIPAKDSSKGAAEEQIGRIFVDRGWVVAAVGYRSDVAEEDVLKAAQWFIQHVGEFKVDRKKIVACGGHLARLLGTQDGLVAAVVDLDGGFAVSSEPRRGSPPVLMSPEISDHVFVWLKKHKIQ